MTRSAAHLLAVSFGDLQIFGRYFRLLSLSFSLSHHHRTGIFVHVPTTTVSEMLSEMIVLFCIPPMHDMKIKAIHISRSLCFLSWSGGIARKATFLPCRNSVIALFATMSVCRSFVAMLCAGPKHSCLTLSCCVLPFSESHSIFNTKIQLNNVFEANQQGTISRV